MSRLVDLDDTSSSEDKENSNCFINSPSIMDDENGERFNSNNNEDAGIDFSTKDIGCNEKLISDLSDDGNSNSSKLNKDDNYDSTKDISFSELLETHSKASVWGFKYGEANRRLAAERNMKIAKEKTLKENSNYNNIINNTNNNNNFNINNNDSSVDGLNQNDTNLVNSSSCSITSENDHKTPHSGKHLRNSGIKRSLSSDENTSIEERRIPLPMKKCLDNIDMWKFMVSREEASTHLRNPRLFYDFNTVTPRMRAILFDWLMEVSEVYHLRCVTYYLSIDYFDRFLTIRPDIPKNKLQLVGITCLHIAAKVEEIYPPSLPEFAYVCDGACQVQDMISCELLILNTLGWDTSQTTISDWLNLYLQVLYQYDKYIENKELKLSSAQKFMFPDYSAYQFSKASLLTDLLSLDPGFLKFRYSTIAAAALYYLYGRKITYIISGIPWEEMKPCVEYMYVFYKTITEANDPRLLSCYSRSQSNDQKDLNPFNPRKQDIQDYYGYQTHTANMQYFEKACILRLALLTDYKKNTLKIDEQSVYLIDKSSDTTKIKLDEQSIDLIENELSTVPSTSKLSHVITAQKKRKFDDMMMDNKEKSEYDLINEKLFEFSQINNRNNNENNCDNNTNSKENVNKDLQKTLDNRSDFISIDEIFNMIFTHSDDDSD